MYLCVCVLCDVNIFNISIRVYLIQHKNLIFVGDVGDFCGWLCKIWPLCHFIRTNMNVLDDHLRKKIQNHYCTFEMETVLICLYIYIYIYIYKLPLQLIILLQQVPSTNQHVFLFFSSSFFEKRQQVNDLPMDLL